MLDGKVLDKIAEISLDLEAKPAVLITGDTYPHKDSIKELGGTWSREHNGWFVPIESVVNGTVNTVNKETTQSKTDAPKQETSKQKSDTPAKKKGLKLTRSQQRKGMSIWDVKLEKLVWSTTDDKGWKVGEVMLETQIVAKTPQQVKVRANKAVISEHPDLDFDIQCANTKWRETKGEDKFGTAEKFERSFGITSRYRLTVS